MEDLTNTRCCFIDHRTVDKTQEIEDRVYNEVEKLIAGGIDTFLFGSRSDFDRLCYTVVSHLKERYPHIRRIYVRENYPEIDDDYINYLLESYEETYYPDKIRNAGRLAYVERNQHMVEQCLVCVFYYKSDYLPPRRRGSRRDITDYQPKSGTKMAYDYAVKQHKKIINIAP